MGVLLFRKDKMFHYCFKTEDYIPAQVAGSLATVPFAELKAAGVNVLFIDLDNTLATYDEPVPGSATRALLAELAGLGFTVVIFSNNCKRRVKRFCAGLEVEFVSMAMKPFKRRLLRMWRRLGKPDKQTVRLIGDQMLTDVLVANRAGFPAILVKSLARSSEKWYTRLNRRSEARILAKIARLDPDKYAAMRTVIELPEAKSGKD